MEKIIMLDIYGMEHIFDNHFNSLDEAEQWASEHIYRVSRKFNDTQEGKVNGKSN